MRHEVTRFAVQAATRLGFFLVLVASCWLLLAGARALHIPIDQRFAFVLAVFCAGGYILLLQWATRRYAARVRTQSHKG